MAMAMSQASTVSLGLDAGSSTCQLRGCRKARRAAAARLAFSPSCSSSTRVLQVSSRGLRQAGAVDAIGNRPVRSLQATVAAAVCASTARGYRGVTTAMFERFTEKVLPGIIVDGVHSIFALIEDKLLPKQHTEHAASALHHLFPPYITYLVEMCCCLGSRFHDLTSNQSNWV